MSVACAANGAWLTVASAVAVVMQAPEASRAVSLGTLIVGSTACLGLWVIYRTKSITYALTLIWAYLAVFFGQTSSAVRAAVLVYAAVIALAGAGALYVRSRGTRIQEDGFDVEFEVDERSVLLNPLGSDVLLPSSAEYIASGVFASVSPA